MFIGRSNDYNPEPHDVEIPAGETRVTFTVSVNNDDIFEGNENFTLSINVSLPTGIMVGEPGQATVIIVDDDRECLVFTVYNNSVVDFNMYKSWNYTIIISNSTIGEYSINW